MSATDDALFARAREARALAYAPYSTFAVGAALACDDGSISTAANVENASYGLSMCAERCAVYRALASGANAFRAVAVAGPDGVVTLPCGACRQVLWEFAPDLLVLYEDAGRPTEIRLAELLPRAFGPSEIAAASTGGARV